MGARIGCNGFIILDASLQVVCPKSLAFLEVREAAFKQVEAILDTLLEDDEDSDEGQIGAEGGARLTQQPSWAPLVSSSGKKGRGEEFDSETGGCVKKRPRGASSQQEEPAVAPLAPLASVLVGPLDDQHSRCASALAALARSQSREALEAVEAAYAEHFGFEEELLDLHLYEDVIAPPEQGAPSFNADRNARTSHFADHAKQLEGVRKQLGALSEADASGSSSRSAAVVPVAFVDQVLRAFESHASRYDNYGERLAAALPETPD